LANPCFAAIIKYSTAFEKSFFISGLFKQATAKLWDEGKWPLFAACKKQAIDKL
jgi:hypothetical protein